MKRIILALVSVMLIFSCGGNQSGSKSSRKNANYFDRDISVYATGASGIDEKIVFHRYSKEYQYYIRAAYNDSKVWQLSDEGHYEEESFDDELARVTIKLDNSKARTDDGIILLGAVRKVRIYLDTRMAEFITLAGTSTAKEVSE